MSNNSDNDKATATKLYPVDLPQKIAIIKGTGGTDSKVPYLVSGPKISNAPGQIITHTVGLMRSQILSQAITTSQPQLANNAQSNVGVVGAPATPIIQGAQIINQGTQNSGSVGGTVRTLPTTVTQLSCRRDSCNYGPIQGLPIQQHTQLATTVSVTVPTVRPQATITTQPVVTTKQLTTSYHVPRGPAAVASLAVPRGSAGPRAPTPSPTPNWSSASPQCYVSRAPRPLQVAPQRTSLRQITPQPTAATVVARVVRPSNTPTPQRTPPPTQGAQSISTVRPPPTKVVPLVQRNYQPVKVVGVATLGRPSISPRTGNIYYEVTQSVTPAQSCAPPISTQHTVTTVTPHLQLPTSAQSVSSSPVISQTPAPLIVQQVAIPQQQTIGHQSSLGLGHNTIVQQTQTSLSHQNNLSSVPQQQVTSHSQSNIIHQSTLAQHQISHKTQISQQNLTHQTPLSQLSTIAHQSGLVQSLSTPLHPSGNQHSSVVQQVANINSLVQASISQPTHQPLSTVNLQAHNQLTSFSGNELGRPPNSPGGPQRPSILRKRDNDGSPMKNSSVPPPPLSTSPPPSPGGSTTVSAASSPGLDDDEPMPMYSHKSQSLHSQQPQHQPSITQIMAQQQQQQHMTQNTQILQTVLQPTSHQNDQQSFNNCSPRKKPRKQLLPSETRNMRGEECEFPSEGNNNISNNIQTTLLSPPHAASPPVSQTQPVEREKPPRRALLGAGWKCGWKATALHFTRPSDVRRREDRKPTVVELAAQKHVQQKANGWKIHHLTAQMDDLCELENNVLDTTANFLKMFESKQHIDHHKILELLKGNIQRTKLVNEGVSEAKSNVLRVFQHKTHVSDILARQADKRCFKKHRNQC